MARHELYEDFDCRSAGLAELLDGRYGICLKARLLSASIGNGKALVTLFQISYWSTSRSFIVLSTSLAPSSAPRFHFP